jgi:hypothetical protein
MLPAVSLTEHHLWTIAGVARCARSTSVRMFATMVGMYPDREDEHPSSHEVEPEADPKNEAA